MLDHIEQVENLKSQFMNAQATGVSHPLLQKPSIDHHLPLQLHNQKYNFVLGWYLFVQNI
jgi:hypothetical protein